MSLLIAVAALAAIGLLYAMDPGGAIAEGGFPDFQEMDWKQLAVWGFRTIGVVLAQLLIIVLNLWPKYRPPQASPWYSGTPLPGSMPAAAVSALEGHMVLSRTMLASIIEMCQRGTLRIEAVGTRVGFLYRLSRQGPAQYDWERTICDSLPSRPTTVDALDEAIDKHEDAIGDQIGDNLQHRGLFHDNPVRVRRENPYDGSEWSLLAGALMGVGSGFWAALWLDQWWANALIGAFAGLVYGLMAPSIRTGMLKPTPAGALEISQWLGWERVHGRICPARCSEPARSRAGLRRRVQCIPAVARRCGRGSAVVRVRRGILPAGRRSGRGLSRLHARTGVVPGRKVGRCGESGCAVGL